MKSKVIGATIKLDGEPQFNSNVKAAKAAVGDLKAEMKALKNSTADQANSSDTLEKKGQLLTKTLKAQKEQQNQVRIAYGNAVSQLEKATKEHEEHTKQLFKETAELKKIEEAEGKNSKNYKDQQEKVERLTKEQEANIVVLNKAKTTASNYHKQMHDVSSEIIKTTTAIDENNKLLEEAKDNSNKCATSIDNFGKKTNTVSHRLADMNGAIGTFAGNEKLIQYFEKASAAAQKLAKSAYNSAKELDEGYDIIAKKTGATGKTLENFGDIADSIFGSMPEEMSDVGSAVGEVNTRFKQTGSQLENTSKLFLKFAKINDTDVTGAIDSVDRNMKIFKVDTQDTENVLGMLTKAGQDTGIAVSSLMSALDSNGATFQELGFDISQSTEMLAEFEANGVDTSGVLTALRKAVVNAAEEGKNANTMLEETSEAIIGATTETEALQIATEVFGTKGALVMTQGLRDGRISLDQTGTSLKNYGNVVNNTYEATVSAWDESTVMINNLKIAGKELAGEALKTLKPVVEFASKAVKEATQAFKNMSGPAKTVISVVGSAGTALGVVLPKLIAFKKNIEAIKMARHISEMSGLNKQTKGLGAVFSKFKTPAGLAATAVMGLTIAIAACSEAAKENAENYSELTKETANTIESAKNARNSLTEAGNALSESFSDAQSSIDDVAASASLAASIGDELVELNSKTSRTAEEQSKMETSVAMLNSLYPELKLSIDKTTGSLSKSNEEISTFIQNAKEAAEVQAYKAAYQEIIDDLVTAQKEQLKAEIELARLEKENTELTSQKNEALQQTGNATDELTAALERYNNAMEGGTEEEQTKALNDLTEAQKNANTAYIGANEEYDKLSIVQREATAEINASKEAIDDQQEIIDKSSQTVELYKDKLKELGIEIPGISEETEAAAEDLQVIEEEIEDTVESYETLYTAALESINGQVKLFEKLADDAETNLGEMNDALTGNAEKISEYSGNLTKAMEYVAESGDYNTAAFVQSLADMGLEGANELANFVAAIEANDGTATEIINNFAKLETAKQTYASNMADLETVTDSVMSGVTARIKREEGPASDAAKNVAQKAADSVTDQSDGFAGAGESNMSAYDGAVAGSAGTASDTAGTVADAARQSLEGYGSRFQTAGSILGQALSSGIASQVAFAESAGISLGMGVERGLRSTAESVAQAAVAVVIDAIDRAKMAANIHSPSRKTRDEVGKQLVLGIVAGIDAERQKAIDAADKLIAGITDSAKEKVKAAKESNKKETKKLLGEALKDADNQVLELSKKGLKPEKLAEQTKKAWDNYNKQVKKIRESQAKALEKEIKKINDDADKKIKAANADKNEAISTFNDRVQSYIDKTEKRVSDLKALGRLTATQEVQVWETLLKKAKKGSQQYIDILINLKQARSSLKDDLTSLKADFVSDAASLKTTLKDNIKELKTAYKEAIASRKESLLSNYDLFDRTGAESKAAAKETAAQLKTSRKELKQNLKKNVKELKEVYKENVKNLKETQKESIKQIKNDLKDNIKELKQAYTDTIKARQEAITGSMSLTEKQTLAKAFRKETYTEILRREVANLNEWQKTLESLRGKITDTGLMAELQEMGPESVNILKQFDAMSAEELKEYESLYAKREKIAKKEAKAENKDLLEETNKQIADLRKQANDEVARIQADTKRDITRLKTDTRKEIDKLKKEYLKEVRSLYAESSKEEVKLTKKDIIDNLKAQAKELREYEKVMKSLEGKISSDSLIEELRSKGPEALKELQLIDSMSGKQLREYQELYQKRDALAAKRATEENEKLKQETADAINTLRAQAEKEFKALKNEYIANLKNLGISVKSQGKTVGKQISNGISSGIKKGMKGVNKVTIGEMNNLLQTIKKTLKIQSPSKVLRDEVGSNMAAGIGVGFIDEMANIQDKMKESIPTTFNLDPAVAASGQPGAGQNIVVENRFYLGERDITDLITKKVIRKMESDKTNIRIAKGSVAYV